MPDDRSRLTSTPLFKHFWTGSHAGLTHQGRDEVSRAGAEEMVRFAREHDANGNVSAPGRQTIDSEERETMRAILDDPYYGSLFELDAKPIVASKFSLDRGTSQLSVKAVRPAAAEPISLPKRVSKHADEHLAREDILDLAAGFTQEYQARKSYFEDPLLDPAEKGARVFGLLRDYAKALWSRGQQDATHRAGVTLLERYLATPYADHVGGKDFNGAGFSAAQSVVLNIDPLELKHSFPAAQNERNFTYLAMDGQMAPAMKFVDAYLQAKGVRAPQAEAYEKRSVLNYLINEESGHTKLGALDERRPFATSGVNWGVVLFPGDDEVAALPVREGFDFSIDVVNSFNQPVQVGLGWPMEVRDQAGNLLTAEKEIHKNAAGKPVSWSAKFKTANGREVPAAQVFGRIVDALGHLQGDGKFTGVADMNWWGFCDRNTAQQVYKARFKIPNLDREAINVKAGAQTITIPRAEAQKLIDVDIPDVARQTFMGFRFQGSPQVVRLKGGRVLVGGIQENIMRYGQGTRRFDGDDAVITNSSAQPITGSLALDTDYGPVSVDVTSLETLTDLGDGMVTAKYKQFGAEVVATGRLAEPVSFEGAPKVDGRRVLKQDSSLPIRGALTVLTRSGITERVPASSVEEITTEMKTEMRFSEYLAYVARNEGVYGSDASIGSEVSNGMRWVNHIELDEKTDGSRPAWVGDVDLVGLEGKLEWKAGDKVVFGRALYRYDAEASMAVNFSGWYQVRHGRIVNEGFVSGEPDFAWGPADELDWLARSTFNPNIDPQLRVALMVNGIKGMNDELATRLKLPADWKEYRVKQPR